ncbi:hypothetical protein [Tardiphaga sp. P9-11]|uniref:hypothetical protein n=1 Tax=Tardiphaga sp. P9-11 TaxID=2024614 RepID=UPI0011F1BE1B|nr:hypothetical protein [Tardiphaga sp. P9-11]
MSYDSYRESLIESYYEHQLVSLVNSFDPAKPTVILLPGGMGSQLERTEAPYPQSPNVITDVIWMDLGIILSRDAVKTMIDGPAPSEKEKDIESYVVAAHGPISFGFGGQTPYDELKDFAAQEAWNYGVFGFDWRRPLAESSRHLRQFIISFRARVVYSYGIDPIPGLTLVCHSMGGMVCVDALRNSQFRNLGFHAILTVATPFYGTSTHQERYYSGMPGILNRIYSAKRVTEIVASLPGPFSLMFLPKSVYTRDGAKLGLTQYPQVDPADGSDADPFDAAMFSRWPSAVADHKAYLARAKRELENVSRPIDPVIAPYFFNARSSLDLQTAVKIEWENIDGSRFNPGSSPSPLRGRPGPGDGTVPFWSAWHAYCRPSNRFELAIAKDHGTLLEEPEVLGLIKFVVENRKLPKVKSRKRASSKRASVKQVATVLDEWVQTKKQRRAPPEKLFQRPIVRAILGNLIAGTKPKMLPAEAKRPALKKRKRK